MFSVFFAVGALAQSYGTIQGTVVDPSKALVPAASVTIENVVSHYRATTTTDANGAFVFNNVPLNPYHLQVTKSGFQNGQADVDVKSSVPVSVEVPLQLGTAKETVTVVEAGDLLENDPTAHTDVSRQLFDKLPLESQSSSLSSLVTLASPGVSADSNGLFHGMGDHASNMFSVDGQTITDQQSKVFSNQIPLDSVESLEVIQGAPPAEYGGKTSLVINVTTRSGQGITTPHGEFTTSYGTFGSANAGFNLAYGGASWGNFISANVLETGRFLDPPEFTVMHDKGNEENVFDRIDYQFTSADSIHLNLGFTRSWFQTPNTFDMEYHPGLTNPITGKPLGSTDQRSQIKTLNFAPTWNHIISPSTVLTVGAFWREDQFNYYPSRNPFSDYAPDLLSESITQSRRLLNVGGRANVNYVKGIHNLKIGAQYEHTLLTEGDSFAIVDPNLVAGLNCQDANGNALPGTPCAALAPYDLTEGNNQAYAFHGHAVVSQLGMFAQDSISIKHWSFNIGVRADFYHGLSRSNQLQPRAGIAYNIKSTNTVLRVSYARTMETPFNENLIVASQGCNDQFLAVLIPPPGVTCNLGPLNVGFRNEFHAGLQQAIGKYLVIDGEYIWKYTHNAFDFGIVGSTPITFPIEWSSSKIPGYAIRVSMPEHHGLTAQVVFSGVAARFYAPQVAGVPIIPPFTGVFRIDHDEVFNSTAHVQYQPKKNGVWVGVNWRFDDGLVAGATPCQALTATCFPTTSVADGGGAAIPAGQVAMINTITGQPFTADQIFQGGFTCGGKLMAPNPLGTAQTTCPASQLGSNYLQIPAPGKENDDHNPQRIQSRSLFDLAVGHDNIFHGDRFKWSARVAIVNLTNKVALYNFMSTFSGTHYVTPRTVTATVGFHF